MSENRETIEYVNHYDRDFEITTNTNTKIIIIKNCDTKNLLIINVDYRFSNFFVVSRSDNDLLFSANIPYKCEEDFTSTLRYHYFTYVVDYESHTVRKLKKIGITKEDINVMISVLVEHMVKNGLLSEALLIKCAHKTN